MYKIRLGERERDVHLDLYKYSQNVSEGVFAVKIIIINNSHESSE